MTLSFWKMGAFHSCVSRGICLTLVDWNPRRGAFMSWSLQHGFVGCKRTVCWLFVPRLTPSLPSSPSPDCESRGELGRVIVLPYVLVLVKLRSCVVVRFR